MAVSRALRNTWKFVTVLCLLAAANGVARANSIYGVDFVFTMQSFGSSIQTSAMDKFPTSYGVLNSMTLVIDAVTVDLYETLKTTAKAGTIAVNPAVSNLTAKDSLGETMAYTSGSASFSAHPQGAYATTTYHDQYSDPGTSQWWDAAGNLQSAGGHGVGKVTMTEFTGAGTFQLTFNIAQLDTVSVSNGTNKGVSDYATFHGRVLFDYTPTPSIPEPITLALLGSGLVMMGWMGRRRIKR